jgi:acetyl-CoA acyltransferase
MAEAFICDYVRTPIGRFGGALSSVRADDLGAIPLRALKERNAGVDWEAIDEVYYGCANQAGEDNRNVARMSLLLAGLPVKRFRAPRSTGCAARAWMPCMAARASRRANRTGDRRRRGKHVPRALRHAQGRDGLFAQCRDLRHHHRLAFRQSGAEKQYGVDSMPETGENVAEDFRHPARTRTPFALASQGRAARRRSPAVWRRKSLPVKSRSARATRLSTRRRASAPDTTLEQLAKLRPVPRRTAR